MFALKATGGAVRLLRSAAVVLALGTACGGPAGDDAARNATVAFFAAVHAHDGARACADLAEQAAEALESSESGCAEQITKLSLPGGTIRSAQVWGDRAQVRLSADTVFLARFPAGWKVTAAGCRRQATGPYDCDVEA
ncbi:hypothetical protein ACRYCC_11155 [Actinomadura scrupuli]|uniref:hypothetical protein n=1 Tax=Actinomadura scrupuli TaxID=559629 RepID=UPI003D9574F3